MRPRARIRARRKGQTNPEKMDLHTLAGYTLEQCQKVEWFFSVYTTLVHDENLMVEPIDIFALINKTLKGRFRPKIESLLKDGRISSDVAKRFRDYLENRNRFAHHIFQEGTEEEQKRFILQHCRDAELIAGIYSTFLFLAIKQTRPECLDGEKIAIADGLYEEFGKHLDFFFQYEKSKKK